MTPNVTVQHVVKNTTRMVWNHPVWHEVMDRPFFAMNYMRVLEHDGWTFAHDSRDNSVSAYHYDSGCIANSHDGEWESA